MPTSCHALLGLGAFWISYPAHQKVSTSKWRHKLEVVKKAKSLFLQLKCTSKICLHSGGSLNENFWSCLCNLLYQSVILNTRIKEKATEVEICFQRICWQTFCIVPSLPCCNWFRRVRHLASAGLSLTEINLFLQACFLLPWSQLNCVGTPWLWAEPARGWWHDAGTALEQHWCRLTSVDLEMPIHQRK